MVQKIDHRGVMLPDPSPALIESLAVAAHTAFRDSIYTQTNVSPSSWADLEDTVQMGWLCGARAAYATLAIQAGAKVIE